MSTAFIETINSFLPKEFIHTEEPMSQHTTFRVGGSAKYFLEVQTKEQVSKIVKYLKQVDREFQIVGNGSNLLVSDKGYPGVIIHLGSQMGNITAHGHKITADAGALLSEIANVALDNELTGMEFASGIPGSIGGATVMNAGAYEGEMKNIIAKVVVCDYEGNILELDNATMEFGYRTSIIRNKSFVVLEVTLELIPGKKSDIKNKMEELSQRRSDRQPLDLPSAGSTFKRPEGHFAGKLIMEAGLKGFQIGGAKVSEKHCGFVVNSGNAQASDIYRLIKEIKRSVKELSGVTLESEIVMIGDFGAQE